MNCTNGPKKRFDSREAAKHSRNTIYRSGGRNLRIYECQHCRGFHLTSEPFIEFK